ncbi:hypothetical protein [Nocardiopsis alborubida]|uniref:Uncharacterized protein n=1 Tax=Nocardiopsis alborubida TaxID=146802 RepID=A0A7X6RT57_9ACTN|nr:hypothetical protein [Nocardiopsis alborubida]NKZ01756.1 hypothetical protein [Nocardiopsis alborubida]
MQILALQPQDGGLQQPGLQQAQEGQRAVRPGHRIGEGARPGAAQDRLRGGSRVQPPVLVRHGSVAGCGRAVTGVRAVRWTGTGPAAQRPVHGSAQLRGEAFQRSVRGGHHEQGQHRQQQGGVLQQGVAPVHVSTSCRVVPGRGPGRGRAVGSCTV